MASSIITHCAEKYAWCTHQELLVACATSSVGPILELGCGHYSTPILHHICKNANRLLVTCDHEEKWIEQFLYLKSDLHSFIVPQHGWDKLTLIEDTERWGMGFVDHNPGSRFVIEIERLRNRATFIVAHDAEPQKGLGVNVIAKTFKYHYVDDRHSVHTIAMSETREIPV